MPRRARAPIQYAERLYVAIRDANFSPISFLAFGNAVKEGVALRNMPRIAAEPFMRIVGEMLDLEAEGEVGILVAEEIDERRSATEQATSTPATRTASASPDKEHADETRVVREMPSAKGNDFSGSAGNHR